MQISKCMPMSHVLLSLLSLCLPAPLSAQESDVDSNQAKPPVAEVAADEVDLIKVIDHAWDNGESLQVIVQLKDEYFQKITEENQANHHIEIVYSEEPDGLYESAGRYPPNDGSWVLDDAKSTVSLLVEGLSPKQDYYFRVMSSTADGDEKLLAAVLEPSRPARQWFLGSKFVLFTVGFIICGSVVFFIEIAKRGHPLKVRKIAGLEAVDEAVGRATEMGRDILYVPGIQDMNDIQTIAGLNILSRVARTAADYEAEINVPTDRSLVMTAARETLQGAYLAQGKPDCYSPDMAYYVTDEQFGYVAYVSGYMVREKPAACFYLGAFFAESLILAETGNAIGAIQVAGTAEPSQLPFFVAACDYTLIGEELFAASAYLSGAPEELGSLKGQDVGKIIVVLGIIAGCLTATFPLPFYVMFLIVLGIGAGLVTLAYSLRDSQPLTNTTD